MEELTPQFDPKHPELYEPTEREMELGDLITECMGNITEVARQRKSSRWICYYHINRSPYLKFLHQDAIERRVDKAEKKLDEAIDAGEEWAIKTILFTQGRNRGYTKQTEQTGVIEHRHTVQNWKKEADVKLKQLQEQVDERNDAD